jgi:hypothetical protein
MVVPSQQMLMLDKCSDTDRSDLRDRLHDGVMGELTVESLMIHSFHGCDPHLAKKTGMHQEEALLC